MQLGQTLCQKMRNLPVASLLLCAGCSAAVAYIGENPEKFKTKSQVQKSFGTPVNVGSDKDRKNEPCKFEEYHTRRKISDPNSARTYLIADVFYLGMPEIFFLGDMVFQGAKSTLFGQTIRFEYDEFDQVKGMLIDGTYQESRVTFALP